MADSWRKLLKIGQRRAVAPWIVDRTNLGAGKFPTDLEGVSLHHAHIQDFERRLIRGGSYGFSSMPLLEFRDAFAIVDSTADKLSKFADYQHAVGPGDEDTSLLEVVDNILANQSGWHPLAYHTHRPCTVVVAQRH